MLTVYPFAPEHPADRFPAHFLAVPQSNGRGFLLPL